MMMMNKMAFTKQMMIFPPGGNPPSLRSTTAAAETPKNKLKFSSFRGFGTFFLKVSLKAPRWGYTVGWLLFGMGQQLPNSLFRIFSLFCTAFSRAWSVHSLSFVHEPNGVRVSRVLRDARLRQLAA